MNLDGRSDPRIITPSASEETRQRYAQALIVMHLLLLAAALIFDALAWSNGNAVLWVAARDLGALAALTMLAAAIWAWRRTPAVASARRRHWRAYGSIQALAAGLLASGWWMRPDGSAAPDWAFILSIAAFVLSAAASWLLAVSGTARDARLQTAVPLEPAV